MDPSQVHIDLEESDVIRDIADVVDAMQKIRFETEETGKGSNSQKDEYVHLVQRLASCMDGLTDPKITSLIKTVVKEFDKNPQLLEYDPRQDAHWMKRNPSFVTSLDKLVISALRENLNTMDAKHHFAQAFKYAGSLEKPQAEKERIYATLLPFQAVVPLNNEGSILQRLRSAIFGEKYVVETEDPLTLKVDRWGYAFEEIMRFAQERGYATIKIASMYKDDFMEQKDKLPVVDAKVLKNDTDLYEVQLKVPQDYVSIPKAHDGSKGRPFAMSRSSEIYTRIPDNPLQYFEKVAKLELPTDISDNLIWSARNNYGFAENFLGYVRDNAGPEPKKAQIATEIDRKSHVVVFQQILQMNRHNKASVMACFSNSTYIVTAISQLPMNTASSAVTGCLTTLKEEESKVEDLVNRLEAEYLRLRKFEQGKIVNDYEVFK